jgi:hypothetical protein
MAGETEVLEIDAAESAKQFSAGFDTGSTETPTPSDAQQPEAKPEVQAVEYAQLTRAEYDALMAKADRADIDKAFGKIGGIERALTQLQAPSGIEVTADDFEELRDEFPELAELQAKGLNKILGKIKGGGDLSAIENKFSEQVNAIRKQATDTSLDAVVNGDWVAEVNSDAYKTWIAAQPAEIKALEASDSIRDAARLLRAFKSQPVPSPKPEPRPSTRQQQLEAAATPRSIGAHAPEPSGNPFAEGFKTGRV